MNLEGYANLEHWVAELDTRIEGILLQRLVHIIKVWCAEFDRTDDGDMRRDVPVRDIISKRRGDKRVKEEKVGYKCTISVDLLLTTAVSSWKAT